MFSRSQMMIVISLIAFLEGGCQPYVDVPVTSASLTMNKIGTGGGTSVTMIALSGTAYSTVTVDQGADFLAANISNGKIIFDLTGTASCLASGTGTLVSNVQRNIGTTQLTQAQEVTTYAGSAGAPPTSNLPSNYREIPDVNLDDNGYQPNTAANSQYGTRPQVACGSSGSISTRIIDCVSKNGSNATWTGSSKGTAGQGTWKLVFSSGQAVAGTCSVAVASTDCYEVWQDQNTGLLWSSSVTRYSGTGATKGINHCLASGNSQNVSTDCTVGGVNQYAATPGSACSESSETGGVQAIQGICLNGTSLTSAACTGAGSTWYPNTLTTSLAVEDYSTGNYSIGKGYMGALSSAGVRWRLPTRYDYMQAEIDGIRFVMPDQGIAASATYRNNDGSPGSLSPRLQWCTSFISNTRTSACHFEGYDGVVGGSSRTTTNSALCRSLSRFGCSLLHPTGKRIMTPS